MSNGLIEALDRLDAAWAKDQTKHYTEMFAAISAVLREYNAWKIGQPLDGSEKMGRLKSGKYSMKV